MKYLVDSDWVVDWLAGKSQAVQLLSTLGREGLAISLITYGEIYEGIYYGKNPQKSRVIFQQFLRGIDVLPLNRRVMQRFAHIRGELRRQGKLIGDPDILIAATTLYHGLTLITRNRSHFQRVPGLDIYQES